MSPARGQLRPASIRSRIRRWFEHRPGWYTAADLYDDLPDIDRQDIRNELKRLADAAGDDGVIRYRPPGLPAKGPGTVYARTGTPPPGT